GGVLLCWGVDAGRLCAHWASRNPQGSKEEVLLDRESLPPNTKAQQQRPHSAEKTCTTRTAVAACCGRSDTPVCSCDRRMLKGACLRSESAGFQEGFFKRRMPPLPGPPGRGSPGNSWLRRLAVLPS